jgi:hemoglobin-like flavoprotein
MNMTKEDRKLIKDSFQLMIEMKVDFPKSFYDCLFQIAPLVKPMFISDRDVFQQHFYELVFTAVEKIEEFHQLQPTLLELGRKHKNFGVKKEQFPIVKTALILTIQFELKGKCNHATEVAWSKYYDEIAEIMIEGLLE